MGSPNRNGSTKILADSFDQRTTGAGHTCEVIDVCRANVHPCVQKDDVEAIRGKLLDADMVVFATPLCRCQPFAV